MYEIFTKVEINTERLKIAKEHFDNGRFKDADAGLKVDELTKDQSSLLASKERKEKELQEVEERLKSNSTEFLIKAKLTALLLDTSDWFDKTITYFEQAITSSRAPDTLFEYDLFLYKHNQFHMAQPLYEEALHIYERLAQANPETYEPDVAMTLNNLANLYKAMNEYPAAQSAYNKALEMYERLAQANPATYEPYVAMTLNNLAILYQNMNEYPAAESAYKKALEIRERLARANLQRHELELASILFDFGLLNLKSNQKETSLQQLIRASEIAAKYKDIPLAQKIMKSVENKLSETKTDKLNTNKIEVSIPQAHPGVIPPDKAYQMKLQYLEEQAKYDALPLWKKITAKKPVYPQGI